MLNCHHIRRPQTIPTACHLPTNDWPRAENTIDHNTQQAPLSRVHSVQERTSSKSQPKSNSKIYCQIFTFCHPIKTIRHTNTHYADTNQNIYTALRKLAVRGTEIKSAKRFAQIEYIISRVHARKPNFPDHWPAKFVGRVR